MGILGKQGIQMLSNVQDQINLGHQIGVRGTPAVFSTDGRQLGGYMKAGQLSQQLGIQ